MSELDNSKFREKCYRNTTIACSGSLTHFDFPVSGYIDMTPYLRYPNSASKPAINRCAYCGSSKECHQPCSGCGNNSYDWNVNE